MATKPVVIRFFAPVIDATVNALMSAVDQKMKEGNKDFTILISSPGGSVIHGLSAYNYLKGLPASIITHNFGSVDSIGVVMYCAGSKRLSVPQARFLFHGVSAQFRGEQNLEEKLLEERLRGLRIDMENIAKVIAANTGKNVEEVTDAMLDRITLNPEEAESWGLVHEIKSELFEAGSEVIAIQYQQQAQLQQQPRPPAPRKT
ncbi:MAG: ATP-dependent Clp protease proteolytic subunit [Chloroflexota bacterium]|jgi:ATP-dependent protease ClpP protease subunit|nr:MAG: ATP-dependent Clp protease proteolytic subunit [Chloroflexota bacterium]